MKKYFGQALFGPRLLRFICCQASSNIQLSNYSQRLYPVPQIFDVMWFISTFDVLWFMSTGVNDTRTRDVNRPVPHTVVCQYKCPYTADTSCNTALPFYYCHPPNLFFILHRCILSFTLLYVEPYTAVLSVLFCLAKWIHVLWPELLVDRFPHRLRATRYSAHYTIHSYTTLSKTHFTTTHHPKPNYTSSNFAVFTRDFKCLNHQNQRLR